MIFPRKLRAAARGAALTLSIAGVATAMLVSAQPAPLSQQELEWARQALQRNGTVEVLGTDAATGLITVRVKSTGEVRKVFAASVVATLPGAPAAAASSAPASSESGAAATARSRPAPVPPAPSGAQVLLSGPGYSIAAAGPAAVDETSTATTGEGAALAGSLPLEHLHEPIVCQGSRLEHIDSRNIEFDGDALSVQDGCELYITNSRIIANGVGIAARAASVHIDNSSIEGAFGSIEASDGAQVYANSSTFKGLIRHLDTAVFHDMGGNVGY